MDNWYIFFSVPLPPSFNKPIKHGDLKKDKNDTIFNLMDSENEIVCDDDIYNHVWFYAFEGFYNTKALNLLLSSKVPITAVIKVNLFGDISPQFETDTVYAKFFQELNELMFSNTRSEAFENTILMQFSIKEDTSYLDITEELFYAIKSISEIKMQHLNYIRHNNVCQMKLDFNLPIHCMSIYNGIMSSIPLELSSDVLTLSSILEETCFQLDGKSNIDDMYICGKKSQTSLLNSKSNCYDPRMINYLKKPKQKIKIENPNLQYYQGDVLRKVLHFYKPFGKLVYDLSFNVLKCIYPFNLLENINFKPKLETHKHHINPSENPVEKENVEVINHYINLFILGQFKYNKEERIYYEKDKYTQYICTYDNSEFYKNYETKLEDKKRTFEETFLDTMYNSNTMDYNWIEKCSSILLMQELLKTQHQFAYEDAIYCFQTDRLLVHFSDWLDEFGLNNKLYEETILTPVCLRDFCRYTTIEAGNWLRRNPPPIYVRKNDAIEFCKGARKIKNLDLYDEYRYLLDTHLENASFISYWEDDSKGEVTFDEMMLELENYPPNTKLKDEYENEKYFKEFNAYDFGTKYLSFKGSRNIFASHDNVKIIVENCKFVDEADKCSVNLQYKDNNLILHSHENFRTFYSFHLTLADETIIVFEIRTKFRKITKNEDLEIIDEEIDTSSAEDIEKKEHKEHIDLGDIKVKNIDIENSETLFQRDDDTEESHIRQSINEAKEFLETGSSDEREKEKRRKESTEKRFSKDTKGSYERLQDRSKQMGSSNSRPGLDIIQGLSEAIKNKRPIYMVNENFKMIKANNPIKELHIVPILERVLHDAEKEMTEISATKRQEQIKRFLNQRTLNQPLQIVDSYIFRITLPNGIHVTCYPSQIKDSLVEIKQEVLLKNIPSLKHEEFRLFTREGYILIKKRDGSITILTSSGKIMDFEKIISASKEINSAEPKPVHCKTVNDYRKKLNKLMKDLGLSDHDYYISRRAALQTKRGYIINKDILKNLESTQLLYSKTSLLNFDGCKTILEGNKITQKKVLFTITEKDSCEEELYYERGDGFKCILKKTAENVVEYPDKTRITTTVTVASEPVDGYVYITLHYKYEHPHYATVAYCEDELLQVLLNNNVVIERSKHNECTVKLDDEATAKIDAENIEFKKTCKNCQMSYLCSFDISPFLGHNNFFDFSKQFAHVEDTYLKHLFITYDGICRINKNYITGALNAAKCNHVDQNRYKRLFALKKSMSGEEFFTKSMINNAYCNAESAKENLKIIKRVRNQPTIKLVYQCFQPFTERLLTQSLLNTSVSLTKYKHSEKKILYYSTLKMLHKIINYRKVQFLTSYLKEQFTVIDLDEDIRRYFTWLASKKEREGSYILTTEDSRSNVKLSLDGYQCDCLKDKDTFAGKFLKWKREYQRVKKLLRDKAIPPYFKSEFCKIVPTY